MPKFQKESAAIYKHQPTRQVPPITTITPPLSLPLTFPFSPSPSLSIAKQNTPASSHPPPQSFPHHPPPFISSPRPHRLHPRPFSTIRFLSLFLGGGALRRVPRSSSRAALVAKEPVRFRWVCARNVMFRGERRRELSAVMSEALRSGSWCWRDWI